jgi:membrane-associated phospholipid phosphatase
VRNTGGAETARIDPLRARRAVHGAGLAVIALVFCWYIAFHDVTVARADAHAYLAFYSLGLDHAELAHLARRLTGLIAPTPYVYLGAAPVIVALVRRRWALAIGLALMIPGAIITSELLKPLLAAPRPTRGLSDTPLSARGSWPSGHATAAMILATACLLASPAHWRPVVAVAGTLFSLAVIYSVLTLGWHYPSDVLGGILVASIWTLLTVAAVLRSDARYGRDLSRLSREPTRWLGHLPPAGMMLAAAALPAAAVGTLRGGRALTFAGAHLAFLGATVMIAVLAGLVLGTLTLALSGSDPAARGARRARWHRD